MALHRVTSTVVSVFAGRIADTGVDPIPIMQSSPRILRDFPQAELLWASPREILNVFQADEIGTHIITVTRLGSSGSFTVGLVHALLAHRRKLVDAELPARAAIDIEMNRLQDPVGKQDQYVAA
jgi:hypothetical protein